MRTSFIFFWWESSSRVESDMHSAQSYKSITMTENEKCHMCICDRIFLTIILKSYFLDSFVTCFWLLNNICMFWFNSLYSSSSLRILLMNSLSLLKVFIIRLFLLLDFKNLITFLNCILIAFSVFSSFNESSAWYLDFCLRASFALMMFFFLFEHLNNQIVCASLQIT